MLSYTQMSLSELPSLIGLAITVTHNYTLHHCILAVTTDYNTSQQPVAVAQLVVTSYKATEVHVYVVTITGDHPWLRGTYGIAGDHL